MIKGYDQIKIELLINSHSFHPLGSLKIERKLNNLHTWPKGYDQVKIESSIDYHGFYP